MDGKVRSHVSALKSVVHSRLERTLVRGKSDGYLSCLGSIAIRYPTNLR